jgi:tetratricopeptide (TPR) repeat protein
MHRYEESLDAYNNAIMIDGSEPIYHIEKGNVLLKLMLYSDALISHDHAINLNDSNPNSHFARANTLYFLDRYQEALEEYDICINLDDKFEVAYYNQAVLYTELYNYGAAQENYVRYIFLGKVKPSNYSTLLSFFSNHGDSPFVVKRLLGEDLNYYHLDSYRSFIELIEKRCLPVHDCLDWAVMNNFQNLHSQKFLLFRALCNYFMGDTAEAYSIFENQLGRDDTYRFSLMEYYYYVRSGLHSVRRDSSIKGIQTEALNAARLSFSNSPTILQSYYAGLILYFFGDNNYDISLAEQCFYMAKGLLAGKYMIWQMGSPEERLTRRKEILDHEARLPLNKSFKNGLKPRVIGRDLDEFSAAIQHYCFYHEISGILQEVHGTDCPIRNITFYEYWHFELSNIKSNQNGILQLSEKELLSKFRNDRIADNAYYRLEKLMDSLHKFLDSEKIEENIRSQFDETFFELERLKNQADIDSQTRRKDGIEDLLASKIWRTSTFKTYEKWNIKGLHYWEVHQQFILYFLGRGQLNTRQAIRLIMYAGYAVSEDNIFDTVRQVASLDGSSDLLKAIPEMEELRNVLTSIEESKKMEQVAKVLAGAIGTSLFPISSSLGGKFLLGFAVKTLLSVIEEKFMHKTQKSGYKEEYASFLKDLDENIVSAHREGTFDETVERILSLA